ncbi:acyl-CoA thioesterase [Acidovorax sp.]|uniref:acyl-CoA thioesterase n=1 Tax=Acidovorax sp. TaxID=1872122 RepID=UPI00391F306A
MTDLPTPTQAAKIFEVELKVRDYECDMDHVVNNGVYLNYLEHARHELLESKGLKFGELSKRGISLVVTRVEIDYKGSLVSGDSFAWRFVRGGYGNLLFLVSALCVSRFFDLSPSQTGVQYFGQFQMICRRFRTVAVLAQ